MEKLVNIKSCTEYHTRKTRDRGDPDLDTTTPSNPTLYKGPTSIYKYGTENTVQSYGSSDIKGAVLV